ncbi:hypothetical protein H6F97_14695 [Microcoleus sp. FACHB-1]|nr:hypothetical protein [Microcoleus sp. FACHB-1]
MPFLEKIWLCPNRNELGGSTLRVGDRMIQQTNDYQREVFNGDLGVITAIDSTEQEVTVRVFTLCDLIVNLKDSKNVSG